MHSHSIHQHQESIAKVLARGRVKRRSIRSLSWNLLLSFVVVAIGLRNAVLVEFLPFNDELSLHDLVLAIRQINQGFSHVAVLLLRGCTFIIDVQAVASSIEVFLSVENSKDHGFVLIDVGVNRLTKIFGPTLAREEVYQELKEVLLCLKDLLLGNVNSTVFDFDTAFALNTCFGCLGPVGFAGWLLGYPFIYCCPTTGMSQDDDAGVLSGQVKPELPNSQGEGQNCLGGVPLAVLSVDISVGYSSCNQKGRSQDDPDKGGAMQQDLVDLFHEVLSQRGLVGQRPGGKSMNTIPLTSFSVPLAFLAAAEGVGGDGGLVEAEKSMMASSAVEQELVDEQQHFDVNQSQCILQRYEELMQRKVEDISAPFLVEVKIGCNHLTLQQVAL